MYNYSRILQVVFVTAISFALFSCVSIQRSTTMVQVLKPQTKAFLQSDTSSLAILVSIYADASSKEQRALGFPDDSTKMALLGLEMKRILEDSPKYQNTTIPIYQFNRNNEKQNVQRISVDDMVSLQADISSDYVVSAEYFQFDIELTQGRAQASDGSIFKYIRASIPVDGMFRLYKTSNGEVIDEKLITDTIVFEDVIEIYETPSDAVNKLPNINAMLNQACSQISQSYLERICPTWSEEVRYFYSDGSALFERAKRCVDQQNWKDAIQIWLDLADNTNTDKAAMACFNLCLGSEMMGDFDLALDWLKQAEAKNKNFYSKRYEEVLLARKK